MSTLAAVPPPAPDPMMQTSNTFGERITCDMENSLNHQVKKRCVQSCKLPADCLQGAMCPASLRD